MSSALIKGAAGIFTGLPGPAMRARGAIRIVDGRIAEMGNLDLLPGEELIDASDCVIYPGLISTHHHLFQSVLKGVRAGIDSPLLSWLRVVPYSYWHKIDEEALRTAAEVLGTKTKKDTVNAALREVGQRLTRLSALARLGEMADQGDFDEFLGNKQAYRR